MSLGSFLNFNQNDLFWPSVTLYDLKGQKNFNETLTNMLGIIILVYM